MSETILLVYKKLVISKFLTYRIFLHHKIFNEAPPFYYLDEGVQLGKIICQNRLNTGGNYSKIL